jgi:hypothetical protein
VTNVRFTNISDVQLVDSISETMTKMFSIQSKYVSTTWCNTTNGCLRILGQVIFSVNCPLACQLRKMNQIDTSNLINPPMKMNLSSTLNTNYTIEIDAFTIGKNRFSIKCFLVLIQVFLQLFQKVSVIKI